MKLEFKDIRKSFDGNEVLHGVTFIAESGKALGLLGRNGAGKTTSIRILMDVFRANSGSITIDGKPFEANKFRIGYMPEERGMYPKKKVMEQLIYFGQLRGITREEAKKDALSLLEKLEISEYASRKLETLSKGNQQKIQLVETLIGNPEIIILDEPFSGLDPVNSQLLKDLVQEYIDKGKLIIFSSHQMSYVEEFCEDVVIIDKGNIVLDGNIQEVQKSMGKGKLLVKANKLSMDEFEVFLHDQTKDIVSDISRLKDGFILSLKSDEDKSNIIKLFLNAKLDMECIQDYKPSLLDIFVEKVGH